MGGMALRPDYRAVAKAMMAEQPPLGDAQVMLIGRLMRPWIDQVRRAHGCPRAR